MNDHPNAVRRRVTRAVAGLPLAFAAGRGHAQPYPSKPLRLVVGFPAGSTTDAVARVFAEQLRIKLGQPAVVENRAGANGMLGAAEVARSAPDGYTILVTNSSAITVNHQVYKKIAYLPERDFAPLTMAVSAPFILVINPAKERTAKVNTVGDLVALAKANPGQLTYGSGGVGNLAHLAFELINNKAGIRTAHVPYKGGAAAHQIRPAARAGGHDAEAAARSARRADDGRVRLPRLRRIVLARRDGAGTDAAGGDPDVVRGDAQRARRRQRDAAARPAGHGGADAARRVCRPHQGRDRRLGRGDPAREDRAGVSGVRPGEAVRRTGFEPADCIYVDRGSGGSGSSRPLHSSAISPLVERSLQS